MARSSTPEPAAMLFGRGDADISARVKEETGRRGEPDPDPPCATQTALSRRRRRPPKPSAILQRSRRPIGISLDILAVDASNQAGSSFCCSRSPISSGNPLTFHERARDTLALLESETTRPPRIIAGATRESAAGARRRGSSAGVCDWIAEAMRYFERAEWLRPSGNDDARLRWNACARFSTVPRLRPAAEDVREIEMLE